MPELPEVETVRRSLEPKVKGKKITGLDIYYSKIIQLMDQELFKNLIVGKKFKSIKRRGKYLLFQLSEGLILIIHLRMTGQLLYVLPEFPRDKHTHLIFNLDDGYQLRFVDIRKFGTLYLLPENEIYRIKGLAGLGPEPLAEDFSFGQFLSLIRGKSRKLKQMLLDQTFLAGIGNIYADEILHEAQLHPEKLVNSLNDQEINRFYEAIRKILTLGITYRGTSIRNYVDGDGRSGQFQELLKVYGREGEACLKCGNPVARLKVAGRSTHFCPGCQKKDH